MAEAGGAGPPALPPAPPHGSPRTLATATGSSASCGPATAVAAAGTAEGPGGGGSARIAVKKAQLRSAPRAKKLEKLGVYSACKVPAGTSTIAGVTGGPGPLPLPHPTSSFPPAPRKCCICCARSAAAARTASHWGRGRGSSRSGRVPLLGRMRLGFRALGLHWGFFCSVGARGSPFPGSITVLGVADQLGLGSSFLGLGAS